MPKATYGITLSPSAAEYHDEDLDQVFRSDTRVFLVTKPVSFRNIPEEIDADRDPLRFDISTFSYWAPRYGQTKHEKIPWFTGKDIPLSRARKGATVLVSIPQNSPRPLCGGKPAGIIHVVKSIYRDDDRRLEVYYVCGEASKIRAVEGEDITLYRNFVPTCMDCRTLQWRTFQVLTDDNPKLEAKALAKAKVNEKRRQEKLDRKPTRFDRIIELVTVKERVPFVPVEPELEGPEGRDAKLESRVRFAKLEKEKRETFKKERR